jgi:hypothetical protein
MLSSTAYAFVNVEVTVAYAKISPGTSQQITATTDTEGTGVIFVVQPTTSAEDLTPHGDPELWSFWNGLTSSIKAEINSEIGPLIVSYIIFTMPEGGGIKTYTFPEDFKGLNGQPSTAIPGTYKVILAFISSEGVCSCCKIYFDCDHWFVIPESALRTALAIIVPMVAGATIVTYKKRKKF